MQVETKIKIHMCYHDQVLTENEWMNNWFHQSRSEPIQLARGVTRSTGPLSGDSSGIEKEWVCKERAHSQPSIQSPHSLKKIWSFVPICS